MPESLADIFQEIPAMVAGHPHVAELSQKIRQYCNGSEYEKAATDYYFEKTFRERFDLLPRLKKRALDESAKELRVLAEKEAEASFPSLSTRASEGFKAVVDNQEKHIEKTVTDFINVELDLAKAFCLKFENLADQVTKTVMPAWETSLESAINTKTEEKLSNGSETLVKAILEPLKLNRVLHWSDLKR